MLKAEERVGERFNLKDYLAAREFSVQLTQDIAASFKPGLSEESAHQIVKETLATKGIETLWHPTKIRFGVNTLCSFRDISKPHVTLQKNDIFYLDLGPVYAGHEGDYGESFRCGGGEDPLIEASRELFTLCEAQWLKHQLQGPALYAFAQAEAQKRGYELETRSAGHRLGDFPHALHHKGKLMDFSNTPSPGLWVLEIHLIDRSRERAAFYEDILGLPQFN